MKKEKSGAKSPQRQAIRATTGLIDRIIHGRKGRKHSRSGTSTDEYESQITSQAQARKHLLDAELGAEAAVSEAREQLASEDFQAYNLETELNHVQQEARSDFEHLEGRANVESAYLKHEHQKATQSLEGVQERKQEIAKQLKESPSSTSKKKLHRWVWYLILPIIGYLEAQGMAGGFLTMHLPKPNAYALAYVITSSLIILSHFAGNALKQANGDQLNRAIFGGITVFSLGICVVLGLLRARAMAIETDLPMSTIDVLAWVLVNSLIYVVGVVIAYASVYKNVDLGRSWNALITEEQAAIKRIEELESMIAAHEKSYAEAIELHHLAYRDQALAVREKKSALNNAWADVKLARVALEHPHREYQAALDATTQADLSRVRTAFRLHQNRRKSKTTWWSKWLTYSVFLLSLFSSGCEVIEGGNDVVETSEVHVLIDRSSSFNGAAEMFTDSDIFFGVAGCDTVGDRLQNGAQIVGTVLNGVFLQGHIRHTIPTGDPAIDNPYTRRSQVKESWAAFQGFRQKLLASTEHQSRSSLWIPIAQATSDLVNADADWRRLVIASDFMECTTRLCFSGQTLKLLQNDPEALVEQLEEIASMPEDLSELEVYLLTMPNSSDESQFIHELIQFWNEHIFSARGATVTVAAHL